MTDAKARLANRERQRRYREAHRDEINEQRKERYQARIEKGKCPRCGGKVKKGYTLCTECCEYQANLNRKYARQRKKSTAKTVKTKTTKKTAVKKTAAKKPAAKKPAPKKPAAKKTAAKSVKSNPKTKKIIKRRAEKQAKAKAKK